MKKRVHLTLFLTVAAAAAFAANAGETSGHEHAMAMDHAAAAAEAPATDGLVQKVDVSAATITVQHGAIADLGMSAMTMPYHVKDTAMLTAVKPGDRIKMKVARLNGQYTIVALQKAH